MPRRAQGYDAAICMYHDQALIPIKTIDFAGGVNVTLGLPFVRTSPDHGTAYDIAGEGVADPSSLIAALARWRARWRRRAAGVGRGGHPRTPGDIWTKMKGSSWERLTGCRPCAR